MKYAFEYVECWNEFGNRQIAFPGLANCRCYQSMPQKRSANWSADVSFKEHIKWSMIIREKIPTEESIICPTGSVSFTDVSWQDELRIRVSNRLIYNQFSHITDALWDNYVRVTPREIGNLFDPFEELDLSLMLKVIKVYQLPFTIEEVKFNYD